MADNADTQTSDNQQSNLSSDSQVQTDAIDLTDVSDAGVPTKDVPDIVSFKDPKTGEIHKITKQAQIAIGHHTDLMRKSETGKLQKKLEEFQAKYEENAELTSVIQTELQSMKDAELSAEERAERKIAKEKEAAVTILQELTQERDNNFNLYREKTMVTDMFEALSTHELNKPNDTMKLIMAEGNAKFEKDDDGKWNTTLTLKNDIGETVSMNPIEAAKIYLTREENSYQLRASIRPGAGTSQQQRGPDGKNGLVYSREDMKNPKLRAEFMERSKNGEAVTTGLG